jgi:CemA family
MKNSNIGQKIYNFLWATYRWYLKTPERSLDEAYKSALEIKAIEEEHFNGNKIDNDSGLYSSSVMEYFESDLKKQLKNARMRLTEFRASRFFFNESNQNPANKAGIEYPTVDTILDKLKLIDEIISKYDYFEEDITSQSMVRNQQTLEPESAIVQTLSPKPATVIEQKSRSKADTTGLLPRSILTTINRLQVELDPNSEQDVVQKFRKSQRRTIISIRFILLLIIVPILTHQIAKTLVVGPIFEHFSNPNRVEEVRNIEYLNSEMREEVLTELRLFEERRKFESLIGLAKITTEEIENELKEKAHELAKEFSKERANAIKNVFSDICSVIAFIWLLLVSKQSIAVLKDFFDHIVYGLSDSAKAFLIILFTDVFVGFHSPHGWEVILEGVSRHWGLPASHSFIYLFIATFPVILDTIFKYWIFRYLNRISPSAVATYRSMNE